MKLKTIPSEYLKPTAILDSDHPDIRAFAEKSVKGSDGGHRGQAVNLFYAVRDGIWYDPYYPFYLPEHYRASRVLASKRGYCVSKAALLCALGRACGIPSRLGFANVRNHLATRQLLELMGTNLFVYHGFTEFYLCGQWVKATPAFNLELCQKHRVAPLEFNGRDDSIFHPYNSENKPFMEYVEDHGAFADVPVERIVSAWKKAYGGRRVQQWIDAFEKTGEGRWRNFDQEEIITE
ncbi:MAG: transglutaminase-like domain-containing protein [Thermodesulfobacteriota bacterium]